MGRQSLYYSTPNIIASSWRIIIYLLCIQWLALPIYAQSYSYQHYTVDDGLPTNYVYGGLQDSKGYIWFYTEKGVSRFDGYEFRNFTTEDGLPTNDVWRLEEDPQGRMWVGCFSDKLVAIDKDSVVVLYEMAQANKSASMLAKINGKLWYASVYDTTKIVANKHGIDTIKYSGFSRSYRQKLFREGRYHLGYDVGIGESVYFFDTPPRAVKTTENDQHIQEYKIAGLDNQLISLFKNPSQKGTSTFFNENLYIAPVADSFVYCINFEKGELLRKNIYSILDGSVNQRLWSVRNSQVLLQTNKGVIRFEPPLTVSDVFTLESLVSLLPHGIFPDSEGNYWITTRDQGVFMLTAQAKRTKVVLDQNEAAIPLSELALAPNGTLYAGGQNGAVYELKDDQLVRIAAPPASDLNDLRRVRKILFTKSDGWWIAREGSDLIHFSPEHKNGIHLNELINRAQTIINKVPTLTPSYAYAHYATNLERNIKDLSWHEPSRRLYAARGMQGFEYVDKSPPKINVISVDRHQSAFYTSDGTLWLGGINGLTTYTNGQYSKLTTHSKIDHHTVLCVNEDNLHRLWVGTDGAGIFTQQGEDFVQIPGTEGLIVQDLCIKNGKAWGATNRGIWQIGINPQGGAGIIEQVYSKVYGLPSAEVMAVEATDQFLYAATGLGLAQIRLGAPSSSTLNISLIIDNIKINGTAVPVDSVYELSHHQNEIEINYTALSFRSQGQITYFYQLENADSKTLQTKNRQLRYGGIKPGQYTLKIFAQDIEGHLSRVKKIHFHIAPPWWQTTAAWVVGVLLLGLGVWLLYRRRVHQIQQQAETSTSLNKQFAELELKALQAQMNPHFVFNSLSAIQYYIQINERRQADDYLAKFAILMRLFLESSKNKYLNLSEELKLIKLYVEMEQLRFRNQFELELDVCPDINQHTTLVPTMLLQPFVENAINHGLFHKKEKGRLSIRIQKKPEGGIICLLEDDGIGRERAMEIRKRSNRNYRSRAIQITNERLQALSTVEGYSINIDITDLIAADGTSAGTRVEINIPEIE